MAKFSDREISDVMRSSGLEDAENITGKSYKHDKETESLGIMLHIRNSDAKKTVMKATNDASFSESLDSYLEIIKDIGFVLDYEEPFHSESSDKDESLSVYWQDEFGLLLHFDTYGGNQVNGGKFHYCWRMNDDCDDWSVRSSSSPCGDGVILGDHDCREAIRFNIRRLSECGLFIKPWAKPASLHLNHHGDKGICVTDRKLDMELWKQASEDRVAKLSPYIRKSIGLS